MLTKILAKIHLPRWLEILLGAVFVLRIPSFFEPFSYGDEMIYLTLGEGIRRGLTLYRDLYDNKPPLLYTLAAVAGNLFWFKVILTFWILATLILFWQLSKQLFARERMQKAATIVFGILTTIPLFEGNIVNAELFLIGPIIAAFFILFSQKLSFRNLFLAGSLFALATLFKVPAMVELPVILFYWLITKKFTSVKTALTKFGVILLGFATPIVFVLAWYFFKGAITDFWEAAFLQNVGYLSSWRPGDIAKPFFLRNLPLFGRAGVVALGTTALWVWRRRLPREFTFACIWILFSLFAVTLSERPYPHYLVVALPSISLLVGILVAAKTIAQVLVIIPLTLTFIIPVYYKFYYYPTVSYYSRFLKFSLGLMGKDSYLATFGGNVVRNYKIAEFITSSTRKNESLFVWGEDAPVIYALTRRLPPLKYVATYHVLEQTDKNYVLGGLTKNSPQIVVILPQSPAFPELFTFLGQKYLLISEIAGAQIWYQRKL